MLFLTDFPASTDAKNKAADPGSEEITSEESALHSTTATHENAEQFILAFEALSIDELASSKEWDSIEPEGAITDTENILGLEHTSHDDLADDTTPIPTQGVVDIEVLPIVTSLSDGAGIESASASESSLATAISAQTKPGTLAPLTINAPANDTANPHQTLPDILSSQIPDKAKTNTADLTIDDTRPVLDIKANTDSSNSPAQIKWENPSTISPEDLAQRGLENAVVKSASSNAAAPSPLQSAPTTGFQITPLVSSSPNIVTPPTAHVDFIQNTQNAAPTHQVAQALATVTHGQDKLHVRLDPPELGRVTVEFHFDGNRGVTAVVSAENADIGSQLRERSEFFLKSLRSAGFENINLSFDTHSNFTQNDSNSSQGNDGNSVAIYETENQLNELDGNGATAAQKLSILEDNLNILL